MKIKITGGYSENGIIAGNVYDKYGSRNPIVRRIMGKFEDALSEFINRCAPESIHEIGCGEGYWVLKWIDQGINARGSDSSGQVIHLARENAAQHSLSPDIFVQRSIYDLQSGQDGADLVVCCEVLEHLESPKDGLKALQRITGRRLILSVPREPLWRTLNLLRGKYPLAMGNTPGHIQHWAKRDFIQLVSGFFEVIEVKSPIPWTMLLCRPRK